MASDVETVMNQAATELELRAREAAVQWDREVAEADAQRYRERSAATFKGFEASIELLFGEDFTRYLDGPMESDGDNPNRAHVSLVIDGLLLICGPPPEYGGYRPVRLAVDCPMGCGAERYSQEFSHGAAWAQMGEYLAGWRSGTWEGWMPHECPTPLDGDEKATDHDVSPPAVSPAEHLGEVLRAHMRDMIDEAMVAYGVTRY